MAENLITDLAFSQQLEVVVLLEKSLQVKINTVSLQTQEDIVAQGWIKVADVNPTDPVTHKAINKEWQDADETILQRVEVSDYAVDVLVRSSFPKVTVNGVAAELDEVADLGHYQGTVSIVLDDQAASNSYSVEAVTTTPDEYEGATDTVVITVLTPPTLLTLSFTGGYPGSQTELKAGDSFQLTGTLDKAADAIDIQDYGAMDASLETIVAGTSFTITGTIADRGNSPQALAARVRARDATTGGLGDTRDTNADGGSVDGTDLVTLNNLHPSVSFGTPVYPGSQQALKNVESATLAVTSSNFDTLLYDSPNLELTVGPSSPTSVTVTRAGGTYNVTTANLRAIANRAANDATTTETTVVNIADVAANIVVTLPASRLVSGGNDGTVAQDHTIQLETTQLIDSLPLLDEDTGGSRGTFQEANWTQDGGNPRLFTRTLRVTDNDEKGIFSWTNASITNLAGIATTFVAGGPTYELGGFVARTLTFPAFSQDVTLNVAVVNYSKLQAGEFNFTGNPAVRHSPQGDLAHADDEYTIRSPLGTNPQTLFWNDAITAATNSSGTAQITDVEEVA